MALDNVIHSSMAGGTLAIVMAEGNAADHTNVVLNTYFLRMVLNEIARVNPGLLHEALEWRTVQLVTQTVRDAVVQEIAMLEPSSPQEVDGGWVTSSRMTPDADDPLGLVYDDDGVPHHRKGDEK
jgi:hypothetical protein